MSNSDAIQKKPVSVGFLIAICVIGVIFYGLTWFLDWSAEQNFASLAALRQDEVSGIAIYNYKHTTSQNPLLLTLNIPKDNETIQKFSYSISTIEKSSTPFRELILSHGLYLVINLENGKTFELLLHVREDCTKTVYIDIVKKPGGVDSHITSFLGSAKSEIHIYEWLNNLNLSNYLGCD